MDNQAGQPTKDSEDSAPDQPGALDLPTEPATVGSTEPATEPAQTPAPSASESSAVNAEPEAPAPAEAESAPRPKSPAEARAEELRAAYAEYLTRRGENPVCDIAFAGPTMDDQMVWHCFRHHETWETQGGQLKPHECPAVAPKSDPMMPG